MHKSLSAALVIALSGCASSPDKIQAQYVSPMIYKDYDCDQIAMEMDHISRRTGELYIQLKNDADADAAQMGIGLVLFWPALLALEGGDGPSAQEYARLRGEYEALRANAVKRKCDLESLPPSPKETIENQGLNIPQGLNTIIQGHSEMRSKGWGNIPRVADHVDCTFGNPLGDHVHSHNVTNSIMRLRYKDAAANVPKPLAVMRARKLRPSAAAEPAIRTGNLPPWNLPDRLPKVNN